MLFFCLGKKNKFISTWVKSKYVINLKNLLKYRCTNTVLGEGDSHLNFTLVKEYEGAVQTS